MDLVTTYFLDKVLPNIIGNLVAKTWGRPTHFRGDIDGAIMF